MIRIMTVDDSLFMRSFVQKMVAEEKGFKIVKEARDGVEALEMVDETVDVILLDIEMPRKNGLEVLKELNELEHSPAVIMFSSLTKSGAKETIKALELGAFDFIEKIKSPVELKRKTGEILDKITAAHRHNQRKKPTRPSSTATTRKGSGNNKKRKGPVNNLVLIGCSTGGPNALKEIIPKLPANMDAAVMIVQHMPKGDYIASFASTLDRVSDVAVVQAEDGAILENGTVYIAPGGHQMCINKKGAVVVNNDKPESGHAPSVDYMFREVFKQQGNLNVVPVVLTGMGADGAKSSLYYTADDVETIVQSEETSVVWGMPGKVVQAGAKHKLVDLEKIADEILKRIKN